MTFHIKSSSCHHYAYYTYPMPNHFLIGIVATILVVILLCSGYHSCFSNVMGLV